jgi:hypothetical protein
VPGIGQVVWPQAEEQAEHGDEVEDRDQAGDIRPGTAQPGQIAAERQHHHQRRQGARAPAGRQAFGHLIRGTLHVVAGGRPVLGDLQPQVVQLGCLLPQGHRLVHRWHFAAAAGRVTGLLADPLIDQAGQRLDVDGRGHGR